MKLRSGRKYKNDLSDVIGILAEHLKRGTPITLDKINTAANNIYDGWDGFPEDSKPFIDGALKTADLEAVYNSVKGSETESRDILVGFEKEYPTVAKESNIEDILKSLKEKQKNCLAKTAVISREKTLNINRSYNTDFVSRLRFFGK